MHDVKTGKALIPLTREGKDLSEFIRKYGDVFTKKQHEFKKPAWDDYTGGCPDVLISEACIRQLPPREQDPELNRLREKNLLNELFES